MKIWGAQFQRLYLQTPPTPQARGALRKQGRRTVRFRGSANMRETESSSDARPSYTQKVSPP